MRQSKSLWEYYSILGLQSGASTQEVRKAYIRLVKQWHPDRFVHDPRSQRVAEEKLKQITEAYAALQARPYSPPYGPSVDDARSQYGGGGSTNSRRSARADGPHYRQSGRTSSGPQSSQQQRARAEGHESRTRYSYPPPPSYPSPEKTRTSWRPNWGFILAVVMLLGNVTRWTIPNNSEPAFQSVIEPAPAVNTVPWIKYQTILEDAAKARLPVIPDMAGRHSLADQLRARSKASKPGLEAWSDPRVFYGPSVPAPTPVSAGRNFPVRKTSWPGFPLPLDEKMAKPPEPK